jgi:hypothetical protein
MHCVQNPACKVLGLVGGTGVSGGGCVDGCWLYFHFDLFYYNLFYYNSMHITTRGEVDSAVLTGLCN